MFEQIILSQSQSARSRWALAAAFFGELLLVGIVIAIPLLSVQQLPLPEISTVLIAPPPPPPPPPPPGPAAQSHSQAQASRVPTVPVLRHFDTSKLTAPRTIPTTTATINDLPAPPSAGGVIGGVAGGVPGGQLGGVLGGILGGVPSTAPPPPPPPPVQAAAPPAKAATLNVLRVGGAVEAARVISAPPPDYPVLAKSARVEGTVRMKAVIGPDGHIENLSVVSGSPLLISAAMDAVKQWTYRPTYLNGKAVKVQTEIDVKFEHTS